jgi:hypothetical protein
MGVRSKVVTGSLYSAPSLGGTLAGVVALKLGVPVQDVLLGASLVSQGLHAVASFVQRRRKSKAALLRAAPRP